MVQLRKGTFETNSSSTHSISFGRTNNLEPSVLKTDDEGYIHVKLGEYGWERNNYRDQESRLSYLVTMLSAIYGYDTWWNEDTIHQTIDKLNESIEFRDLSEEIAEYTGTKGIIVDYSEGYIDHQSCDRFSSMSEYLDYWNTSVLQFVFGDTVVHTDNDNHY